MPSLAAVSQACRDTIDREVDALHHPLVRVPGAVALQKLDLDVVKRIEIGEADRIEKLCGTKFPGTLIQARRRTRTNDSERPAQPIRKLRAEAASLTFSTVRRGNGAAFFSSYTPSGRWQRRLLAGRSWRGLHASDIQQDGRYLGFGLRARLAQPRLSAAAGPIGGSARQLRRDVCARLIT